MGGHTIGRRYRTFGQMMARLKTPAMIIRKIPTTRSLSLALGTALRADTRACTARRIRPGGPERSTGWLGLSKAKPQRRDDRICGVEDSATATQLGTRRNGKLKPALLVRTADPTRSLEGSRHGLDELADRGGEARMRLLQGPSGSAEAVDERVML